MVRGLGPIPADARESFDLLPCRKRRAVGLPLTHDIGNRLRVSPCKRRRKQDVIELAQMALLRPTRMVEGPAIHLRPPLDNVFTEPVCQEHVQA